MKKLLIMLGIVFLMISGCYAEEEIVEKSVEEKLVDEINKSNLKDYELVARIYSYHPARVEYVMKKDDKLKLVNINRRQEPIGVNINATYSVGNALSNLAAKSYFKNEHQNFYIDSEKDVIDSKSWIDDKDDEKLAKKLGEKADYKNAYAKLKTDEQTVFFTVTSGSEAKVQAHRLEGNTLISSKEVDADSFAAENALNLLRLNIAYKQ